MTHLTDPTRDGDGPSPWPEGAPPDERPANADPPPAGDAPRTRRERLDELAHSIDDVFWVGTADMRRLLYISPACERVWGRPAEHFYRDPMSFLADVHPQDRRRVADSLPSMAAGNYNETFRVVRPDGQMRTLQVRAFPVRNVQGQVYRLAGLSQDISATRQVEAEQQAEHRFLEHLLHVQELDRKLTAYDIHDGFLQLVIGGIMRLESLAADPPPTELLAERLQPALAVLREAVDEARRTISGLRPPGLDEQGLVAAVERLVGAVARSSLEVRFEHPPDFPRLESVLEGNLYRIVQEALANTTRHSQARSARVALSLQRDWLRLVVEDEGIGFEPGRQDDQRFGLRGICERAGLFGGTATVRSAPGGGTQITVDVPLQLAVLRPPADV